MSVMPNINTEIPPPNPCDQPPLDQCEDEADGDVAEASLVELLTEELFQWLDLHLGQVKEWIDFWVEGEENLYLF